MKKFLAALLVTLIFGLSSACQAEEVASHFVWNIKNPDEYSAHEKLFKAMNFDGNIIDARNKIYQFINAGAYSYAILQCERIYVVQKVAFGKDYFDESFMELMAKLYLLNDEPDKAEQKINLLTNNARDNFSVIRALNLKAELCNHCGNYHEALKITEDVTELLRKTPDEKLSLVNSTAAAKAYCGLNETQKSLELAEKLLPQMQNQFGKTGIETFLLITTLCEDYLKSQRYGDFQNLLMNDEHVGGDFAKISPFIIAKVLLQGSEYFFKTNDAKEGERYLMSVFEVAKKYADISPFEGLQLYSALKETVTKNLGDSHPLVLVSELGIAEMNNTVGDIPQSIEICKKNLPKFKKVFGEQCNEIIPLMKVLSDDYILLGNYSDAKKIIDERLNFCKKKFGDHHLCTVESVIDLANFYVKLVNINRQINCFQKLTTMIPLSSNRIPNLNSSSCLPTPPCIANWASKPGQSKRFHT